MKTITLSKTEKRSALNALARHCSRITIAKANKEFSNVPASTLLEIYSLLFVFMFLKVFVI